MKVNVLGMPVSGICAEQQMIELEAQARDRTQRWSIFPIAHKCGDDRRKAWVRYPTEIVASKPRASQLDIRRNHEQRDRHCRGNKPSRPSKRRDAHRWQGDEVADGCTA